MSHSGSHARVDKTKLIAACNACIENLEKSRQIKRDAMINRYMRPWFFNKGRSREEAIAALKCVDQYKWIDFHFGAQMTTAKVLLKLATHTTDKSVSVSAEDFSCIESYFA